MDRYEVAYILREIAFLLEFQDEKPFRAIAYMKAASALEEHEDFENLLAAHDLESIPGIGKEISRMIESMVRHHHHPYHSKLKENFPPTLFELLGIPRLSRRIIKTLYTQFGIKSLEELEDAIRRGDLKQLKGFGPKTTEKLLKAVVRARKGRSVLWKEGMKIATSLCNQVKEIHIAGQLRRKLETINKIDLIVEENTSLEPLVNHTFVKKVEGSVLHLKQGIDVEITTYKKKNFFFCFLCKTGSHKHVKQLKSFSKEFSTLKEAKSEEEIYHALSLQYIPPELREGMGEIEAAHEKNLPKLIVERELRGAFHCHTQASDGRDTIEEMAQAAIDLGWEYIGISDHSKSSYQAGGLNEKELLEQVEHIRKLNKKLAPFQIFSGSECDILKDGMLDFSDEILQQLDFVIVSIHRYFSMDKKEMTNRIIRAIENPFTTIVGHLTGRVLHYRDSYAVDIDKIVDACIANGKVMELNAYPNRLDMDWRYWHKAKEKGLKCAINPDAHAKNQLQNCFFGVQIARKGWLTKNDVINTYPLTKMKRFLKR